MSVQRQYNALSQERLEVVDLRSLESSICYDADTGWGFIQAGQQPLVVSGLTISVNGTAGNPASNLVLNVANALIMHPLASESGTIFRVPSTTAAEQLSATNPVVIGSFSAGTQNFVGLDLIRTSDASSADLAKFLDANTLKEVSLTVPKARTLVYRLYITQSPFSTSANVLPIAIVTTDSSNNVSSIADARNMLSRLGTGGDIPNPLAPYNWPDASRSENPNVYNPPTSTADPFAGGDKGITSLKSVLAAIQSSLWELRGGSFWYSPVNRDNVQLLYTSSVLSNGDNFSFSGSTLKWEGLKIAFENSPVSYNIIQDNASTGVTLLDQQCLYVDIQRGSVATIVPGVANLTALGTPVLPGTRFIIAWREGSDVFTRNRAYNVGRDFSFATTTTYGVVELHQASLTPGTAIVFSDGDKDTANGIVGLNSLSQAQITATTGRAFSAFVSGGTSDAAIFVGGFGSGAGIVSYGGAGGNGITAIGGNDSGSGDGVDGSGGLSGGNGGTFVARGGNSVGASGNGNGSGAGVAGTGGSTGAGITGQGGGGGAGVAGTGGGTGIGITGDGGGTSGNGGTFVAHGGNSNGISATGHGSGVGVSAFKGSGADAIAGDGNINLSSQSAPATTTGIGYGIMNASTMCRAWVRVNCTGAGAGNIQAGQNIASVIFSTQTVTNDTVTITFTTAFTTAYAPVVTGNNISGGGVSIPVPKSLSLSAFVCRFWDPTGAAFINLNGYDISFIAFGT